MNRLVLCTFLLSSLGGLACTASRGADEAAAQRKTGAPLLVPSEQAGAGRAARPAWERGKRYRYRLKTNSRVFVSQGALYDFDLTGLVELVVMAREGEKDSFHLTLEGAELKSRVPGTQNEFDRLVAGLKAPFFFELERGLVATHYLSRDAQPLVAAIFRSIPASLQFAGGEQKTASFTATEYDTTGKYLAEYSAAAAPNTWMKRKQRYLGILLAKDHPKEAERVVPQIEKAEATIHVGAGQVIDSVRQVDELSLLNAETPLRSHVEVSLTLEGTAPAEVDPSWAALKSALPPLAADAPFMSTAGEANLDEAKTRGLSYDTVTRMLEELAANAKPSPTASATGTPGSDQAQNKEHNRLFIALGALMRRQPESVTRAVSSIRDKSAISDTLVDALGSADARDAQSALGNLAADKSLPATLRNRAAISLSRTGRPSLDSANVLLSLVQDEVVGTQALYGIGAYCKVYQATGDVKAAAMLGDYLVRRLAKVRSELELTETLRALANAAYLPALDAIRAQLKDPRKLVRVDAASALQALQSPAVDPTLVDVLDHDSARAVKLAAIQAMAGRAPSDTLVAGLRRAALAPDPHVRYRAVEVLIRWLPQRSELREPLRAVAKNDQEEKIRSLAGKVP